VLLTNDWAIWSSRLNRGKRRDMLKAIFMSEPRVQSDVELLWVWAPSWQVDPRYQLPSEQWAAFCRYITHQRRYFRPAGLARAFLADLTAALPIAGEAIPKGTTFFRARRGGAEKRVTLRAGATAQRLFPYPRDEIGAPPPRDCTAGRMNPAGIPVLYLATDELTAVGEVRPSKGQPVTVAQFSLKRTARGANLVDVPGLHTPFGWDSLEAELDKKELLRGLGKVLSEPLLPGETELDYIPTQYVSEFVRSKGYDGMRYPSAMGPGHNLVLFSTGVAEQVAEPKLVRVTNVHYAIEDVKAVESSRMTLWPCILSTYWIASDSSLRDTDFHKYAGMHCVLRNPIDGYLITVWPEESGRAD